ncbi:uncharacterized protein LOC132706823 [Cylas formicarius]|uniref:uncharacterized protein LOC132706823 n=1 Tax=Cylas formicarius TaxID=197179 RepID=UPI00295886B5|nr:uncharacterized protein LOC132706823 [Cylas formicarius]
MRLSENTTSSVPPDVITTTKSKTSSDDAKYVVVPIIVIIVIMLASVLVYYLLKQRKLIKLRREIQSFYEFDSEEQEWESLNSYRHPNYSDDLTDSSRSRLSKSSTTNL